jgi:hypothetical protein
MPKLKRRDFSSPLRLTPVGVCLGGALLAAGAIPQALAQAAPDGTRLEKLEKENQDLRKRLDALEAIAQKEGILPSGNPAPKFVSALSDITISGFAQASWFFNSREPSDKFSDGYLWNTRHNSFSINKVKLTLASPPVERSGDAWDAAFRVSMIWGEDAPVLNTGGEAQGLEELREAYAELNVPIGTGLNVKAGQLISLLNYESGDGGAANANFSQGYQWFYTGNGPSAGVQLGYTFTDWLDVKVRLHNGLYAGALDGNNGKAVMGSIGIKPDDKTWLSLIGFGGDGNAAGTLDVNGGSVLAGRQLTEKVSLGFEFDYFSFDPDVGAGGDLWSIGGWLSYDFTPKVGLALRGEYLDDKDGAGINTIGPRAMAAITSPDTDGTLSSLTLTLNLRPAPNIKIQPEVRYDHTSYTGGFDGKKDRVIFGAGITYLF